MTTIFFVRHCEPDQAWKEDRTRPLTKSGLLDSKKVTETLRDFEIHRFFSSPYARCYNTIKNCGESHGKVVEVDERLIERKSGDDRGSTELLSRRWADFSFCEVGGENLESVQMRNIAALKDILTCCEGQNVVIGTHGTALSTIINYFDESFGLHGFLRILYFMPYIVKMDFEGPVLTQREELLIVKKTMFDIK